MRAIPTRWCHWINLAELRCASLVVPACRRAEWFHEWKSELWHVRAASGRAYGRRWSGEREVAAFCRGAFQDAFCLRMEGREQAVASPGTAVSAKRCLAAMLGLIVVSCGLALLLPRVHDALRPSPYRDTRHLMLIEDIRFGDDSIATMDAALFQAWTRRKQDLFDGFAFYRVGRERIAVPQHGLRQLDVATSSENLFTLLGAPLWFYSGEETSADGPRALISEELWRTEFAADEHLAGKVVRVAAREVRVAGVVPSDSWRLPGRVDLWLLEPGETISRGGLGFVVAHLVPSSEHAHFEKRWSMSVPRSDGNMDGFLCVSIAERTGGTFGVFLFTVFLACLALPATTSLSLGEYRVTLHRLPWSDRLKRWSFLAAKILLLLPAVFFLSLDLAHLSLSFDPLTSTYIQIVSSFTFFLFGLRWALRDQRRRCPVCLGTLAHPARVGEPSRNFLGWNGTELICVGGHGLLHIPEIQTSWFSTQRWLYLDASWEVLFAEAVSL